MKTAFEVAGLTRYIPTKHAIDRAMTRFGINAGQVAEWANARIRNATDKIPQGNNTILCVTNDARILIDDDRKTIVTVYSPIRTDFLRPTLEREIRKIKRESTRRIRVTEKRLAVAYSELAERMTNYVNARNPNTRELIEERILATEENIDALKRSIERQKDEVAAKIRAIEIIAE